MNVQFKLNLPINGWDYLPLPNLTPSNETLPNASASYELIVKLTIPWFPRFVSTLLSNYLWLNPPIYEPTITTPITAPQSEELNKQLLSESSVLLPVENPLVTECRGFIGCGQFSLCEEGVGGTYFIKNTTGTTVAVFKPQDEEPGAPNNPKDLIQEPLLPAGGGYAREIAAYLLDRNFAGVPETLLLSEVQYHTGFSTDGAKTGSLQRFIKNDGLSSDMGSSVFPVDAVHRVGVLDLRIFNMDRNGENLLVKKNSDGSIGLVPIDHTYSLPPITSLDSAYFEWHYWPQSKKPFSQETKDFIRSIDIESDAQLLKALGIGEPSILTMIVTTLLLQEAVIAGWTLFDLANFVSRSCLAQEKPSRLEQLLTSSLDSGSREDIQGFLSIYKEKLQDLFNQ